MTAYERVLEKLKRQKYGITFQDFPAGFRLAARIYDLRNSGYDIQGHWVKNGDCRWIRYILMSKERKVA